MVSAAVLVEALDIRVIPYILALKGGYAFGLELDTCYGVLCYKVTAGSASLDGQGREIPLQLRFLDTLLGTEIDLHGLCLTIMVYGEPKDLGFRSTGCYVVILVAGYGGDGKALGVMCRAFAFTINHIVYGALIPAVENAGIKEVLPKESLVLHLCDAEFTIPADNNYLRKV